MPKARQTCTECSMRRQKCDRLVPCTRCVKRGEADKCTREWPGNYDPKVHRIYPRSQEQGSPTETSPGNKTHSPEASSAVLDPELLGSVFAASIPSKPTGADIRTRGRQRPGNEVENAASVLEFLSWGRTKLSDFDVKARDLLKEPQWTGKYNGNVADWEMENGFGGTGAAQMSFLQLLMPSRRQVFDMVQYHETTILWYHGSYHGPTFRRELVEVYQVPSGFQIRSCDLRWLALLFAIMAGSMACASRQTAESWGFRREERAKLNTQWYKAAVTCLNLSNYMLRHHLYSVQAIATLTLCAHLLGFSNEQSVLLGSALKIAQSLGLQRIGPDPDDVQYQEGQLQVQGPAHRERLTKREMGRRVWLQICLQDWFSIPFSEMYSINKLHVSTIKPMNCDDETMEPVSDAIPTNASFGQYLFDIASLMPESHDAACASNTLYTKYQQVLEYDARLRSLAADVIPPYLSMKEAIDPRWPDFVPWARRSVTICVAHKIIMVHRSFLGRSFTNHAFAFTRRSCMAAAKTILKEAKQAYDEEGPMLWIDQAFMVAAGITLSLDIFHRAEHESEFEEHHKLVENTITMLGKFDNSMVAARGVRLLSSLLSEQTRLAAGQVAGESRKHASGPDLGRNSKRQKFDIPKFVENFCSDETFTQSLRTASNAPTNLNTDDQDISDNTHDPLTAPEYNMQPDLSYETFAELFPPQTGISNNFLFEDLLNFDIV